MLFICIKKQLILMEQLFVFMKNINEGLKLYAPCIKHHQILLLFIL